MKDILIKIDTKTSRVILPTDVLGITGENLQGKIKFQLNEWIEGQAILLVHQEYDGETHDSFVEMNIDKENKTYYLEIKNSLLKGWKVDLQLQITQPESENGIPVFKSNTFYLKVEETLDASTTIPEEYPTWIETANSKIVEIDEAISLANQTAVDLLEQAQSGAFDGEPGPQGEQGPQGEPGINGTNGIDGKNATINGISTLTMVAGKNVLFNQTGDVLEIGSEAEVPDGTVIDTNYVHTDNNYTTEEKEKLSSLENYDDTEIRELISNINQFTVQVVDILPALGEAKVMYLVPKTGEDTDVYDEYLFINEAWEHIGSTQVDLTNYYTKDEATGLFQPIGDYALNSTLTNYYDKTEVDALLANKQNIGNYPNYKGHVTDASLLPEEGQPSGYSSTSNFSLTKYVNLSSSYTNIISLMSYKQYYLFYSNINYGVNGATNGFMTDYPEQIQINFTNWEHPIIKVIYDPDKPVYIYNGLNSKYCFTPFSEAYYNDEGVLIAVETNSGANGQEGFTQYTAGSTQLITRTSYFTAYVGYSSSSGSRTYYDLNNSTNAYCTKIISNIQNIKIFYDFATAPFKIWSGKTTASISTATIYESIQHPTESYYYNDGMTLGSFGANSVLNLKMNESELIAQDLYSVGENYDLYYVNNELAFEQWSKSSSGDTYTKVEIDAMIGTANTELESIINGG